MTDAGGRYVLQEIEPGTYNLSAERNGFTRAEYEGRGAGRETIALNPGQHARDVLFRMRPHAVIAGRILDEEGEPVERAQVSVMRYAYRRGKRQLMPSGTAMTDDLGEYRIFGLAPGKYYLTVRYRQPNQMMTQDRTPGGEPQEGYAATYFPGTNDPAGAAPIEPAAGTQLRGIDVTLRKTRTVRIRGRVVNTLGEQVPRNTMLRLLPKDQFFGGFFSDMVTRVQPQQGTFEFRGVAPGAYTLMAQWWDEGKGYRIRQPVDVGNNNLDNVTLLLTAGLEIKGQVRVEGPEEANLAVVQVWLDSDGPNFGGRSATNLKEDDSFTLSDVSPDQYTVHVMGLPQGFYVKSIRMGDMDALETGLNLTNGAAGSLEIVLNPNGGQVEGAVINTKQQPAAGATVALVRDAAHRQQIRLFKTAMTDAYGHFTITGIAPGDYTLFAWGHIEDGAYQDPEFLKPYENQGYTVAIREGGKETAQLKLIPAETGPGSKNAAH